MKPSEKAFDQLLNPNIPLEFESAKEIEDIDKEILKIDIDLDITLNLIMEKELKNAIRAEAVRHMSKDELYAFNRACVNVK